MRKLITTISLCLVSVVLLSLLASCGGNPLVGTWVEINPQGNETGSELVLANDGTGSVTDEGLSGSVKWSVNGNRIFLTVSMCGVSDTTECTYTLDGDKLTLVDTEGETMIYRRKSSN